MERNSLYEQLARTIGEEFEVEQDKFAEEALLTDDLGIDSLDIVDVVVLIDHEFGVRLQAPDLRQCRTYGQLVDLILAHKE